MRSAALLTLLSAGVLAKPVLLEIKNLPASPKAALAMVPKEKPGPFRRQLVTLVEAKVREKGTPLTDPDAVDAMVGTVFGKVFDEMAAPGEVWSWTSDDGPPHGDVLIRHVVKLLPGVTSAGFSRSYTVTPKGKRIDRGFLNSPCTLEVSVAKSPADWADTVEQKSGWVGAAHEVLVFDNVARVAVQLLSPGRSETPSARHERPVWVAFFQREKEGAEWTLALWEPYTALEQKAQESNVLPADPKEKLTDAQKQLVLALRMGDVALINPARKVLSAHELKYVQLDGLTESPVDAKHVSWLEPYRTAAAPTARAVAVLRLAQLGAAVTPDELLWVVDNVHALALQAEALGAIGKLLDGSKQALAEPDQTELSKLGTEPKVLKGLARVKVNGKPVYYRRGEQGWAVIAPPAK